MLPIQPHNARAFTLIELLVTVAIIGILAAIAIPEFVAYRTRGFDARSLQDLRSAVTAQEAYYTDYEHYLDCIGSAACEAALPSLRVSEGVVLQMFNMNIANTPDHFTARSFHPLGTHYDGATAWQWNSNLGGLQN